MMTAPGGFSPPLRLFRVSAEGGRGKGGGYRHLEIFYAPSMYPLIRRFPRPAHLRVLLRELGFQEQILRPQLLFLVSVLTMLIETRLMERKPAISAPEYGPLRDVGAATAAQVHLAVLDLYPLIGRRIIRRTAYPTLARHMPVPFLVVLNAGLALGANDQVKQVAYRHRHSPLRKRQ
jgi:hypothetical protein